jgi:hypothetical protein
MRHAALFACAAFVFSPSARADVQKFGKPIGDAPVVALAELVKNPDVWAGKRVRTEGKVSAVCAAKGCWMTLAEAGTSVRVTFKDYGFFVPPTSAGATAILEGTFGVKTIPEATAKHYASETPGGKPEKITGDQKELSLVATGVELKPAAQ